MSCCHYKKGTFRKAYIVDANMNRLFKDKNDLLPNRYFVSYWLFNYSVNLEKDLKAGIGIIDSIGFEIHLYPMFIEQYIRY